jgi:hypothetical protein
MFTAMFEAPSLRSEELLDGSTLVIPLKISQSVNAKPVVYILSQSVVSMGDIMTAVQYVVHHLQLQLQVHHVVTLNMAMARHILG